MKQVARGVLLAVTAVLLAAGISMAGVLEGGIGARGVAMGQAQVAAANDISAMAYNPAALSYARKYWDFQPREFLLQAGMVGTHSKLYLNNTEQNDPYTSAILGGAIVPVTKRLTLGFAGYLPNDWTLVLEFFRGPTFARYRARRWFYISAGASYQLTKRLSLGGAFNYSLGFTSSELNLDTSSILALIGLDLGGGAANVNPAFDLKALFVESYELGALYRPFKWLNIGAFYRWRLGNKFHIPIKLIEGLLPEINMVLEGYMYVINPPQMAFGVAVFPTENLTIAFDMQYDMWSKIKPWMRLRTDTHLFSGWSYPDIELDDVWWPKFGVEWKDNFKGKKLSRANYAVRLGYSFYKTPFPPMTLGSKSVDNDAHFYSGGVGIGYKPRKYFKYIGIDYFYQYIDLVKRKHVDIARNPAVMISEGYVIYQGFNLVMIPEAPKRKK